MLNFHRAAVLLLPSVPRRLARLVDAAAQTPAVGAWGSASAAGQNVAPTSLGDGDRPESAVPAHPTALSGPPACETQVAFYPHPANRWDLADERLGALLDRWGATS